MKWRDRSNSYRCFSIACTISTVSCILPIKWGWEIGIIIWWVLWTAFFYNQLQRLVIQHRLTDTPNLDRE